MRPSVPRGHLETIDDEEEEVHSLLSFEFNVYDTAMYGFSPVPDMHLRRPVRADLVASAVSGG